MKANKLLSVILCIAMVLSTVSFTVFANDGAQEPAAALEIDTVEDLLSFAEAVKNGDTFAGKTVKLTANIDLKDVEWTMIGEYQKPFSGEFDGGNFTISNMEDASASDHKGFFAHLNEAYVHDMTFVDVKFTGTCEGALYAGALVGEAESKNVIKNVDVNGIEWDITSKNGSIGSVAGYSYDTNYIDCAVTDATFKVTSTASVNMGAFVGQGRGVGAFSTAYGNTSTYSYTNCTVNNAAFDVSGKTTVGGFIGCDGYNHWANYGIDCTVTGLTVNCADDDAQYTVGGFMGSNNGANYGKDYAFENCSATGTVNASGTNTASTFGGFVGYVGGRPVSIESCTANVAIDVAAGDVGGFCGETLQYFAHEYKFDSCEATGNVATANGTAGGFIANIQHGGDGSELNVSIENSTASGTVAGITVGGIVGVVNDNKNGTPTGGDVLINGNTNNTDVTDSVGKDDHDIVEVLPVTIGNYGYKTLEEAVEAANDGDIITLADGNYTMPSISNAKELTIVGSDNAVIELANPGYDGGVGTAESTLTFEGVTVKFNDKNYRGFKHTAKVTYKNCIHSHRVPLCE